MRISDWSSDVCSSDLRDTPEILSAYVSAFNPNFVGLTGSPEQLSTTAKSFKAYYAKSPGATPEQYSMDHASSFYLIDTEGEARVLVSGNASAQAMANENRRSDRRRVGKGGVRTGRYRWWADN